MRKRVVIHGFWQVYLDLCTSKPLAQVPEPSGALRGELRPQRVTPDTDEISCCRGVLIRPQLNVRAEGPDAPVSTGGSALSPRLDYQPVSGK
jgi:hypothetical protein